MAPRVPLALIEALELGASSEGGSVKSNVSVPDDKDSRVLFATCKLYGYIVLSCTSDREEKKAVFFYSG